MARTPKAGIDVAVNERPAIAGLKRLAKEFGDTAVRINAAAEVAGKAWGALTSVVGGAISVVEQSVKLAMEQERVERRAIAAISAKVDLTQAEFEALQASNAERQRSLGIGDEVQLQLQGTLAALGVQKDQLDAATEATIGLAEITGGELPEAAKAVGKALTGNVDVLKEYGIKASSVAEAQAQLASAFEIAQAQSDTMQSRLAALDAAWGDLQETFGALVTESDGLKQGIDAITIALTEVTDYFRSEEGKQAAREFFGVILELLSDTINATLGLYRVIQDLRGEGDRGGAMSRAGGALSFLVETSPAVMTYKALTKGITETQADIRAAYDQLLGRGPNGADAPIIGTLEQLANRLQMAARSAREAPEPRTPAESRRARAPSAGDGLMGTVEIGEITVISAREARFREEWAVMEGLKTALAEQSAANEAERREIEMQVARETLDHRNELHKQAALLRLETSATMQTAELEQLVQHHQAMQDAEKRQQETLDSLGGRTVGIFSAQLSQMVIAAASGEQSISEALGGFVRAILTQVGTMLISTGMAALALQLLSFIPGLWGVTGPPAMGIGPALAAIALGTALVGGASFIGGGARASTGGGSSGGGGMARAAQAPRAPRTEDVMPRGFGGLAMAGAQPYTVNIQFNGVVGDERRAARMIEDVLRRGR